MTLVAAACGGGGADDAAATTVGGDGATTTAAGDSAITTGAGGSATTAATTTVAGGDTTTTTESSTTAPIGDAGTCTVVVTGDMEEEWTYPQANTSFSTDYWFSEDDLRATVEFLGEDIVGATFDELVARGEPIITLFSLSCSDPDDLVQGALALHTNGTLRSDIPMGPGSYEIIGGLFDAESGPGAMLADLTVVGDTLFGTVGGSGTVEITRWDTSVVEGGFSFDALEIFTDDDPMGVHVEVSFSFLCRPEFLHSGCD